MHTNQIAEGKEGETEGDVQAAVTAGQRVIGQGSDLAFGKLNRQPRQNCSFDSTAQELSHPALCSAFTVSVRCRLCVNVLISIE